MKTIEERAEDLYSDFTDTIHDSDGGEVGCYLDDNTGEQLAIDALNDQDRISRQEERERCIRLAQEWHCSACGFSENCKIDNDEVGHCIYIMPNDKCMDRINIRKAIEA